MISSASRLIPENRPHTDWRISSFMGIINGIIAMAKVDREHELSVSWELLNKQFHYDHLTGVITRLTGTKIGAAGYYTLKGRNRIMINGKRFLASRLAWFLYYGKWPEKTVDHINGNPSDDRIDNLRLATDSEQQWNKGINRNNTSGVKGVSFNKRRNEAGLSPWEVYITVYYKRIHIGFFNDLEDAVNARREAAMNYHGDFSNRCLQWA